MDTVKLLQTAKLLLKVKGAEVQAMPKLRFSCVIDGQPLFRMQALNWAWTLLASGSAAPDDVVMCLVRSEAGEDDDFARTLQRLGVTVRAIERFGSDEAAYCNKLVQLSLPELRDADCAVLCDADLAFAGDIRPWLAPDAVRAKVVDADNPPLELLDRLYAMTGLTARPRIVETTFHQGRTYETNCNGGLYCVPARWLEPLGRAWTRWAEFALANRELLGRYRMHADQIGFCFAMLELGLPFDPLPAASISPPIFRRKAMGRWPDVEPLVLHYHRRSDASGFLLPIGSAQSIGRATPAVVRCRSDALRSMRPLRGSTKRSAPAGTPISTTGRSGTTATPATPSSVRGSGRGATCSVPAASCSIRSSVCSPERKSSTSAAATSK